MQQGEPKQIRKKASWRAFPEILRNKAGNISMACEAAGIRRSMYYDWLKKYPAFRAAVEEIQESLLDLAESHLREKIQEGYFPAIAFFLENKGKTRGYGKQQVDHNLSGQVDTRLEVVVVRKDPSYNHLADDNAGASGGGS